MHWDFAKSAWVADILVGTYKGKQATCPISGFTEEKYTATVSKAGAAVAESWKPWAEAGHREIRAAAKAFLQGKVDTLVASETA